MSQPYEIRASNYTHPDREHGQHTNGPASLFLRRAGGPWHVVLGTHQMRVVLARIDALGLDFVLEVCCHPVEEPTT